MTTSLLKFDDEYKDYVTTRFCVLHAKCLGTKAHFFVSAEKPVRIVVTDEDGYEAFRNDKEVRNEYYAADNQKVVFCLRLKKGNYRIIIEPISKGLTAVHYVVSHKAFEKYVIS